jgi:hypothetical protein
MFHCPVCRNINIKGKYGFIELDEAEDAEDAVKELDGKSFNGGRYAVPEPEPRVPDPNWIRIQSGLLSAEGFFCNLDVLYGGLGIGT